MISGRVSRELEAQIELRVRGPSGIEAVVTATVDSGFTAAIALPIETTATLGLPHQNIGGAVLADGSIEYFDVHSAEVSWDGTWRKVLVYALGNEVLIGMGLLRGHALRIDVIPGGEVAIDRLP